MKKLLLQRLAVLPLVLLGISLLVFMLGRMIPGDPAVMFAGGPERADPARVAQIRADWGLDESLPVQYFTYLGQLIRGDLGWSFTQQADVTTALGTFFPPTIEVVVVAMLIGVPIGLFLGVQAARKQGSATDNTASLISIVGVSVPLFWVALMFVYLFSVVLGWVPLSGRMPAFTEFEPVTGIYTFDAIVRGDFGALGTILHHLALPALTLAIIPAAVFARFSRATFIDVLSENYIRTAHAYGIPSRTIVWKLAAKNAFLPLITLLGLLVPGLIVGAVLIEVVFSWPGVGNFLLHALNARDYVVVQSVTMVIGVLYVVLNLLADLSYAVLDPRTRRS